MKRFRIVGGADAVPICLTKLPSSILSMSIVLMALSGSCPALANSADATGRTAVSFPMPTVLSDSASFVELAQTRPVAAAAILSIIQETRSPFAMNTMGHAIFLTGIPTLETVRRMLEHASEGIVFGSMQSLGLNPYGLEQGPFLEIWWDQTVLPSGETLFRISSMLVDGAGAPYGPPQAVEELTVVALRKPDAG